MRHAPLLTVAMVAFGCSQSNSMTSPEIHADALSVSVNTDSQPILPGFDLDAAEIISSGKFETATFALG